MLFTTKKKHAVTSSERAHSITWYKQKRRRNRWASKQVSWRYMSLAVLIICTDVELFWFHHSTGLCYLFLLKSEERCIWHIKCYRKCMVFYEEL